MTNKIIEAARKCGFTSDESGAFRSDLARFYAIARAEALEDAYSEVDKLPGDSLPNEFFRTKALKAIRTLKEQQHG